MSDPLRFVLVGAGGMGASWCRDVFTHLRERGKGELVAAVDVVPEHLRNPQEILGLPADRCYTDLARALDENEADAVTIVTPPEHHEAVVDAALAHDLHVLSEKPIADSMEASCRVVKKVRATDRKMCVTMSRRFMQDALSLEALIRSGDYGRLNYLVQRVTYDWRRFGVWGEYRHRMADPLLVEGTVHHFDVHRALTGSDPATIYARTWNPPWGEYDGDSTALILIDMQNGTRVLWEGAKANASTLNEWHSAYVRAECEHGTLRLEAPDLRVLRGDPPVAEELPLLPGGPWGNALIAEQFCDWVAGRRADHPTEVGDNLQCAAMVFAAIESSRTGQPVDVQAFVERHLGEPAPPSHLAAGREARA